MPTLHERLGGFSAAVFAESPATSDPGLEVYRRNLRANFAKVLALEFPAVEQLLGSERFSSLAQRFQQQCPSRSGNLHGIGAPFPAFLRAALAPAQLDWIADVAALEWAWEESAVAADAGTRLDASRLAALTPDELLARRASLHPALRVVSSRIPVVSLWRSHVADADGHVAAAAPDYRASLDAGAECARIERPGLEVSVDVITEAEATWYRALAAGASLGAAIELALESDGRFDAGTVLGEAIRCARIIDLHAA